MGLEYKSYDDYSTHKSKWWAQLPAGWTKIKLKLACDKITDGAHFSPKAADVGFPYVTVRDLKDGVVDTENSARISSFDFANLAASGCKPKVGDVLFSKDGTIGKVAVVEQDDFVVLSSLAIIRPAHDKLNASFTQYVLLSTSGLKQIESMYAGAALKRITLDAIVDLEFSLPPLEEQKTIARFLDHETAKIDELIAKQERLIELLKEKRQAVISHAVTKGLDADVPMKDSGVEWLGEVPEHWTVKRLKHISPKIGVGLVINPSTYVKEEGVHFLFGGDIVEYGFKLGNTRKMSDSDSKKLHQSRLRQGDLVCVRVGYPGITAVIPEALEGANCASVMVIRRGSFVSDWLCFAMNSRVGRTQVELVQYGAAQKQYNIADAIEFWFAVPPFDEQKTIAEWLTAKHEKFERLQARAAEQIALLKERRTALISAAVTGKIDVRNWKPDDNQ